jgi:hypothetical protein
MPLSLHSGQVMLPRFSEETGAVCCRAMERCRCGTPSASRKRRFHTPVSDNDDDDLHRELAHCQERLLRGAARMAAHIVCLDADRTVAPQAYQMRLALAADQCVRSQRLTR